jgi:hypothetical protein
MKTPHPYAEILRAIADGETVQWQNGAGEWCSQGPDMTLFEIRGRAFPLGRYRIKPRTIRVGEVDVPEPMREAPARGKEYWVIDASHSNFTGAKLRWSNDDVDNRLIERGICYDNPTDAETAGRAIAALFAKDKP